MGPINTITSTTTPIHFIADMGGKVRLVCMPNVVEFHATREHHHHLHTNDPRAVTCPACKKTPIFIKAK